MAQKLLVVDDAEEIRLLLKEFFQQFGYDVTTAGSGKEAEKIAEDRRFDLVLTDIRMADGDGIELLETLRSRDPLHPPVFVMSAYADFGVAEALARGASELLLKPLDLLSLAELVKRELARGHEDFSRRIVGQHNMMLRYKSRASAREMEALQFGNSGCFVAGMTTLVPEALVEFSLQFEEEDLVWNGCARLRWARSRGHRRFLAGYGLQFLRLDEPMRTWFLNWRQENPTAEQIPVGFSKAPL